MVEQRRDYRRVTPFARASQQASDTIGLVKRRIPMPSMMSGTVTAWDGTTGSATVETDASPDEDAPEEIQAESHIGPVLVGERVWLHTIGGATYVTGRGVSAWQAAKDSTSGGWFPQGRLGSDTTQRLTRDPYLGAGGVAQAGFSISAGTVTMTYTITFGTGATLAPGSPPVAIDIMVLPLPVAIAANFGWDLASRLITTGTAFFHDGQDYVGTHLSKPGRDYVELRIAQTATGGTSLGILSWPNGNGASPIPGTLLSGTFSYPAAV